MNNLFRKVMCNERLPNKKQHYDTNVGGKYFDPKAKHIFMEASYWFDPIKIPTDEEIEKISKNNMIRAYESIFRDGFKAAIKHLTGGK